MNEHTVKSFDRDLLDLKDQTLSIMRHTQEVLNQSIRRIQDRTFESCNVYEKEDLVYRMSSDLENKIIKIFTLRKPVASDFRSTFAHFKIIHNIERIISLSTSIDKYSSSGLESYDNSFAHLIQDLCSINQDLYCDIMCAYREEDVALVIHILSEEKRVDCFYESFTRGMINYILQNRTAVSHFVNCFFIAKNLERIGDHIHSAAKTLHYLFLGRKFTL